MERDKRNSQLKSYCKDCSKKQAAKYKRERRAGLRVPGLSPTKKCPQCHEFFPRTQEHFYVSKRSDKGVKLDAWCRECRRQNSRALYAANREEQKRLRNARRRERIETDPEYVARAKRYAAERRERERADPELLKRRRQDSRITARLRAEKNGGQISRRRPAKDAQAETGVMLDPEPVIQYMRCLMVERGWTAEELATQAQMHGRRVRAVLDGESETVHLDWVDRLVTSLGDPGALWLIYDEADLFPTGPL